MITKCYFAIVVCSFFSSFLIGCENPTFRPYKPPHREMILYSRSGSSVDTGYTLFGVIYKGGREFDTLWSGRRVCIDCNIGDPVYVKFGYTMGSNPKTTTWQTAKAGICGVEEKNEYSKTLTDRYSLHTYSGGCSE